MMPFHKCFLSIFYHHPFLSVHYDWESNTFYALKVDRLPILKFPANLKLRNYTVLWSDQILVYYTELQLAALLCLLEPQSCILTFKLSCKDIAGLLYALSHNHTDLTCVMILNPTQKSITK